MVSRFVLYSLCLCILLINPLEAVPQIEASIDSMDSRAHFPLPGTITITHSKEEKIDPQSFIIEGKHLDASFVKDAFMSSFSDTLVSIYRFQLPPQEKGLFVLPAISVKINGQTYYATPSSYEVQEETAAPRSATHPSVPATTSIFRLEASVEGSSVLYPAERTKLIYRIFYNRSVDLIRSELPMIHPAHFQKIGDVQIKDLQLSNVTVQELTQEVEASEIGTFSFGPSLIEGYAYTIQSGKKIYDPTLLKAEAPFVTLEVKPFPGQSQPFSFTGALGRIQIESQLTTSHALLVGDTLQLQLKIQGISNLGELDLPSLECQPGFSGFFQISDDPPLAEIKEDAKFFYIELRPLNTFIKQIPVIEVSSYDSVTDQYIIQQTDPIPITVTAPIEERAPAVVVPLLSPFPSEIQWPTPFLSPLEIIERRVEDSQPTISWLKTEQVLWLLPIGFLGIMLQIYWKKKWEHHRKDRTLTSEKVLGQALKTESLPLLEQAFWTRLWEKEKVPRGLKQLEALSGNKELAIIRSFIFQLQAWQYSRNKVVDFSRVKRDAKKLYTQI